MRALDPRRLTNEPRAGAEVAGRLLYLCLAACFLALMWRGFSHASFNYTYNDPPFYLQDAHKLTHGYFRHNLEAWAERRRGGPAEFMHLTTEGGFPFVLFVVGKVDARLPFLINVLIWPLAILALARLMQVVTRDRLVGQLAGLFLPLLFLLFDGRAYRLWSFYEPYRDPLSFLFVFGSLVLVSDPGGSKAKGRNAWLAGLLIGLGSWVRMPSIVTVVPAALALALWSRAGFKRMLWLWVLLGAGIVVGLLPLAAQTLLEGKHLCDVGQVGMLMRIQTAGTQLPKLHPFHLPSTFPAAVAKVLANLSWWSRALIAAGFVVGLLTQWRSVLVVAATAFMFLIFYSCYYTAKARYFIPVHLCLTGVAAWFPAWVISKLSTRSLVSVLTAVAVTATVGVISVRDRRPLTSLGDQWQRAVRFEQWLDREFEIEDVFLTNRRHLKTWIDYFSKGCRTRINWVWSGDNIDVSDKYGRGVVSYGWMADFVQPADRDLISLDRRASVNNLLASGRRVFLMLSEHEDGPTASWWRNDLSLHFDLAPYRSFWPDGSGAVYTAYEITHRREAPPPARARLASLGAQLENGQTAAINFDAYETAPTAAMFLKHARLNWRGHQTWQKDRGGDGRPRHRSRAAFLLSSNTTVWLPPKSGGLDVQLHMTLYAEDMTDLEAMQDRIRYRVQGQPLTPSSVYRESKSDAVSCIQKVRIPASAHTDDQMPELEIAHSFSSGTSVRLRRIEFIAPSQPRPLPLSPRTPLPFVWQGLADRDLSRYEATGKGIGNPYFRLLDAPVSIELAAPCAASNAIIKLVVQSPPREEPSGMALTFQVNGGQGFVLDIPEKSAVNTLCLPARVVDQTFRVDIYPQYQPSASNRAAVLLSAGVYPCDDMAVPPRLTMRADDPFAFAMTGLWPFEAPINGRYLRWTQEASTCLFPLFGEPRSLRMVLYVEAPYPQVGDRELSLQINGHTYPPCVAQAGKGCMREIVVEIAAPHLRRGINQLVITTDGWRPTDLLGTRDHRLLGVHLAGITWHEH